MMGKDNEKVDHWNVTVQLQYPFAPRLQSQSDGDGGGSNSMIHILLQRLFLVFGLFAAATARFAPAALHTSGPPLRSFGPLRHHWCWNNKNKAQLRGHDKQLAASAAMLAECLVAP